MDRPDRERLQTTLTAFAAGDRSAFDSVFDQLWPLYRAYAWRIFRDPAQAEDAAQQALLRLMAVAPRFDPERDASSWVIAIAANEFRAIRRRQRSVVQREAPPDQVDPAPDALQRLLHREAELLLGRVIDALRPSDRQTLLAALGLIERPAVQPTVWRKRWERLKKRLAQSWRAQHER